MPGENGETGKFLWSLSLLIRPEWYPDSYINSGFSDLKRFAGDYEKVFLEAQMWRHFACLCATFLPRSYPVPPGVS